MPLFGIVHNVHSYMVGWMLLRLIGDVCVPSSLIIHLKANVSFGLKKEICIQSEYDPQF